MKTFERFRWVIDRQSFWTFLTKFDWKCLLMVRWNLSRANSSILRLQLTAFLPQPVQQPKLPSLKVQEPSTLLPAQKVKLFSPLFRILKLFYQNLLSKKKKIEIQQTFTFNPRRFILFPFLSLQSSTQIIKSTKHLMQNQHQTFHHLPFFRLLCTCF